MRLKKIVAPTLLAVLTASLLIQLPVAIADRSKAYESIDTLLQVQSLIQKNYVTDVHLDDEKTCTAMIDSMIDTLDDPHTVYVPPADAAEFEKDLRGTYVGIGCEVNIVDDYLTIVSPMDGSPALAAGILAGDVVLEIEGEPTLKMPVEECTKKLMGEPGTQVKLKVRHLDGKEQEYSITRSRISTRTVKGIHRDGENWTYCIDQNLGLDYIRVSQFNETTPAEMRQALERIQVGGVNGLILDLRDNGGGSLQAAVDMANLFLKEGLIVSVKPRPGRGEDVNYYADAPGTLPDFPLLVLVNGQTASASEIVSGSLQDNGRAKVMGTRTYGKGSVQEVRDLDYNRGTLKLTVAHYYLKSGRNINRSKDSEIWGVDPDPGMVVPVSDEDYIEMFKARRDFEIIRSGASSAPACVDGAWIRANLKDEQLARAVEAISFRVAGGDWPKGESKDSTLVAFDQEVVRSLERRNTLIDALNKLDARIEELQHLEAKAGKAPLLPPDANLLDGTITLRDKQGNVIGTYKIEGGDVALALDSVKLTPVAAEK